ncbi:MAG: serine/threonine protein kinase [Acidobacteriaceae bacterium]|nr:serine/threonine protein kinase [Acidobacteriaceae bacterium]
MSAQPGMSAARWKRIKSILDQALEVEPYERDHFVAEITAGDPVLRRDVKEFLSFSERADTLIPDGGAETLLSSPQEAVYDVPARAGPYRILREIGRGGMGVVCLAKRDDGEYERLVALKLIVSSAHRAKFAKLFWRERQILAQLDHPNIARLLDGGTIDGGQPYYAMEFVEGEPLDKYCQRQMLSIREKLQLFVPICAAVSYAHRNLIIHGDLKPKNVLVTREGVPKLLDFGVARMLVREAHGERTTGMPLTPFYASPEQIRGEPLTVATDIYSLGVLLYELLGGRHPYGRPLGAAAAFRAVLDQPPIPLRQQNRNVPADLENIVMMALRKEPERRYSTVDAFSQDVKAFLSGFPVHAAPDTFSYRFRKFAERNRWAMTAATIALVGTTLSGVIIWQEKQQAEMRFQQVRQLAHSVVFELDDAIEDLPGSSRARELLIARGLEYLNVLAKNRGHDPALTFELAQAYMKIGSAQGDFEQANVGDHAAALASYTKARELLLDLRQRDPQNRDVKRSLALVDTDIAVLSPRAPVERLLDIRREAVALFEDLARTSSMTPNSGKEGLRDRALAHFYLAVSQTEQQNYHQALPLWQDALRDYTRIDEMENHSAQAQRNVALTEKRVADVYYALGQYADSIAHGRKAAQIDEARVTAAPQSPTARMDLSFDLVELGWCFHQLRDETQASDALNRAIALRRQVAAADPHDFRAHSELETVLRIAGVIRSQTGMLNEALTLEEQAAAVGVALHARDPENTDESVNLALDCFELGDLYRGMATRGINPGRNWRAALTNFRQAQTLVNSIPAPAFDDANDREKVARLPERISECLLHDRSTIVME